MSKRRKSMPRRSAPRRALPALGVDLDEVSERLRSGKAVRRTLQPWGRLHVERSMPFFCVYRRPPGAEDRATQQLITSQAAYLLAPGGKDSARDVARITHALAAVAADDFGACLIVEVSAASGNGDAPLFRIVKPRREETASTVDELEAALTRVSIPEFKTRVVISDRAQAGTRKLPLLRRGVSAPGRPFLVDLQVRPIYRDADDGRVYPLVHRHLRRSLSRALKRAAFEFTQRHTTHRPKHFHALGRRLFLQAVWEADSRLAEVAGRFDMLLLTTPRNAEEAWRRFKRNRCQKPPRFSYRPLPFDPIVAKRDLFQIPIERIEDPTLADMFREQQDELDRRITMVSDRGTRRFRHESAQLYGVIDDGLMRTAEEILSRIPARARENPTGGHVSAEVLSRAGEKEIARLRKLHPAVNARVELRDDTSGLMVSRGNLLISRDTVVPASRVEALIQHEVGTHVLTYYNGDAQPFKQLRVGLPGYDELQEGLAVLAEYLVGGLSRPRLRLLAARVVAVRRMLSGATFVDVFRELDEERGFSQRTAFMITMRVFRSGGQVKDAVYLRGLIGILEYVRSGERLDRLFTGKFALKHLPIIRELEWRNVLAPPPLRPSYMDSPAAMKRLDRVRAGGGVIDLITETRRAS